MKFIIFSSYLLLSSFLSIAGPQDTIKQSEKISMEMSVNVSSYNSLSISIEKEYTYGKWKFGPRVELVNMFSNQSYVGEDDSTYLMSSQIRIRLAQIEYQINPRLRVGVAPFWMLGPIPSQGFYKTPTTFYAHLQLKEGLSLETSLTSSERELVQLSIRKVL
jgi:hypothetical protein